MTGKLVWHTTIRFLSDGIRSAVETALAAADGKNVVVRFRVVREGSAA